MSKKTKVILISILVVGNLALAGIFGMYKYREYQAEKRTQEIEELYRSVAASAIKVEEETIDLILIEPEIIEKEIITNTTRPWYKIDASGEKEQIYAPPEGRKGYRYGPSIIKYKNGLMDMWMSRPGNSSTAWDYIAYRHYNLGEWLEEEVVLSPTPGSKDQCSCCDPGVVYFDGYYYLGYTGTDNYGMEGMDNSAFVARSENPNGPYEKWNGSSWGGNPEPIIPFNGNPNMWGIGEVSFVVKDDKLYIYYTHSDEYGIFEKLCIADICENWPSTIEYKGIVSTRYMEDSYDVVYAKDLDNFLAFSIGNRMTSSSYLTMFWSLDGGRFAKAGDVKSGIPNYAHNLGIIKDEIGHIDTSETQTIGYAYGPEWGAWPMVLQDIQLNRTD